MLQYNHNKHNRNQPIPDSTPHGVTMGPVWGRQDPGGPHVGPMNFAIWYMHIFGNNKLVHMKDVINLMNVDVW